MTSAQSMYTKQDSCASMWVSIGQHVHPVHWTACTQYANDNEATYIFSLLFDTRMHSTILSLLSTYVLLCYIHCGQVCKFLL